MRAAAPVVVMVLAFLNGTTLAHASSPLTGTYYIDNSSGSNCSDSNAGTSTSAPWCDFNNLNGQTFGAGAQILLRRGDTFTQELGKLYGGGNSSADATIGAYGTGALPIISGSSSTSARDVWVQDGDYWNVQDIKVANAGMGIVFWYDTLDHQNLSFSDIQISNINGYYALCTGGSCSTDPSDLPGLYDSVGLYISGDPTEPTSSQWVVKNISMSDITAVGGNVEDAVDISGMGGMLSTWPSSTVQNVTINNVNWSDNWGCPNFDNTSDLTILGSSIQGNGAASSPKNPYGTTGLFFWEDSYFTVSGSILGNTPDTSSTDETGTDFEAYDDHGSLLGNWIGGDAGKGVEVLALSGRSGDHNNNHTFSDNAFTGNGSSGGFGAGDIESYASSVGGTIQNNVYSDAPLVTGDASGWTQTDNSDAAATDISNAGVGFTGTQGASDWSYEYWNGSSDQDLSYDSTNNWWGSSSGYISNLSMLPLPNASEWMARTWTAPKSGSVVIRGWLTEEQQGGDGIQYGITDNGTWQSGYPATMAGSNTTGVETDLTLTVAAGEQIQFQVNAGASGNNTDDLVSWNPTVAYVTALSGTHELVNANSGDCLQISGDSTSNGADAVQWECDQGASPNWTLTDEGSGQYEVVNNHSGLCLQINGNSTSNGADAVQWECDQGISKLWTLASEGGGQYELVNANSGLCLQINGNSTSNGADAVQWECDQGISKDWTVS